MGGDGIIGLIQLSVFGGKRRGSQIPLTQWWTWSIFSNFSVKQTNSVLAQNPLTLGCPGGRGPCLHTATFTLPSLFIKDPDSPLGALLPEHKTPHFLEAFATRYGHTIATNFWQMKREWKSFKRLIIGLFKKADGVGRPGFSRLPFSLLWRVMWIRWPEHQEPCGPREDRKDRGHTLGQSSHTAPRCPAPQLL